MKVLVTGAAGLVGAAATRALLDAGHEVVAPLRVGTDAWRLSGLRDALTTSLCALEDEAALSRLFASHQPSAVLHAAWYAAPRDYLHAEANDACVPMTLGLGRVAAAAGVTRFVGVGSCAEYAVSQRARRDDDACTPTSRYGRCKVQAHEGLKALFAGTSVGLTWARLFHMHGPGEDPARLVPWVAAQLRAGQSVGLTAGAQQRDHLHVEDVGRALALLVEEGPAGALNVASGVPVTLHTVLQLVGELVGRPELLRFGERPYRDDEVMHLYADVSRLRALGFRPRWDDLRRGLANALNVTTSGA